MTVFTPFGYETALLLQTHISKREIVVSNT